MIYSKPDVYAKLVKSSINVPRPEDGKPVDLPSIETAIGNYVEQDGRIYYQGDPLPSADITCYHTDTGTIIIAMSQEDYDRISPISNRAAQIRIGGYVNERKLDGDSYYAVRSIEAIEII